MKLDELLTIDEFRSAINYIIGNNTSSLAPYHNNQHMINVASRAHLCHTDILNNTPDLLGEYNNDMSYNSLIVAALFHDFNHSMGGEPDDVNVKNAIAGMREWYDKSGLDTLDIELMSSIIESTQFPYVIENSDLNILQKIIRDCDLLGYIEDGWFQNVILGLKEEMKVENISEMYEGQIKFISNLDLNTEWAKNLHDIYKNPRIVSLKILNES